MAEIIDQQTWTADGWVVHDQPRTVDGMTVAELAALFGILAAPDYSEPHNIQPAMTAASPIVVRLPAGTYNFSSTGMVGQPMLSLTDVANFTLEGAGIGRTVITLSGGVACGILRFLRCSNITVRGISFVGNNVCASDGLEGSAIFFDSTGASAPLKGWHVTDCEFSNFRGAAWVRAEVVGDQPISDIVFARNRASGGSDRLPSSLGTAAAAFAVRAATGGAVVTDVLMQDNWVEASNIKQGLAVFHVDGTTGEWRRIRMLNNTVLNAGRANEATVKGAYAVMIYNVNHNSEIRGNNLHDAVTCGIYGLSMRHGHIEGNCISGVTDTDDATLPRGAIALNAAANVSIIANHIRDCSQGIEVTPADGGAHICTILGNHIAGGIWGINLFGGNGAIVGSGYVISGNVIKGQSNYGICVYRFALTTALKDMHIEANIVEAVNGIGTPFNMTVDGLTIINNKIRATTFGIAVTGLAGSANAVSVCGNRVQGGTGFGLRVSNATAAQVLNNHVSGAGTAGTAATGAYYLHGAEGHCWGNTADAVVAGASSIVHGGPSDLGLDVPTFAAPRGTLVQRFVPEAGGFLGWVNIDGGATWKDFGAIAE